MANEFPPEPGPLPSDYLPGEQPGARPMGITFRPGAQLAGYELGEQIGRGGMAVVYRARDERLDRWVALKVLAPALARDESFRQRFIRESQAAAAVDHPNIIPVFEAGEADGVLFIAMRYVAGGDVGPAGRGGPLDRGPGAAASWPRSPRRWTRRTRRAWCTGTSSPPTCCWTPRRSGRPDHVYLSDFGLSKVACPRAGADPDRAVRGHPGLHRAGADPGPAGRRPGRTSTRWPARPSSCSAARRRSARDQGLAII